MTRIDTLYGLLGVRFHAKGADAITRRLVGQYLDKGPDRWPLPPRLKQKKIVMLWRDRQKTEVVEICDRRDRHAPIGTMLGDRGGHRVMRARLMGVTRRLGAAQQTVDEHARAGAGIAVDHQDSALGQSGPQRGFGA